MPRLRPNLLAIIVPLVLVVPIGAQQPSAEDETSPAILRFVRERLAGSEGLGPADGVEIRETRFFRGTLRVRGTVRNTEQLEKVRRTIDALRGDINSDFDVRITNIDYSGLTVVAGGQPAQAERIKRMPAETPQSEDGPEVQEESFDFLPPPPPPPAKERKHRHHRRHKDEQVEPYGTPSHGVPPWEAGWSDPWTGAWIDMDDGLNAFSDPNCANCAPHKHHHWRHKHCSKDP